MGNFSTALVELIHHVELSESDWWQRASDNAVLGVLWLSGRPLSIDDLQHELGALGHEITLGRCEETVNRLIEDRNVVESGAGYQLSEGGRTRIQALVDTGEDLIARTRSQFEESLVEHCSAYLDIDVAWDTFNETLLLPLVQDLGAATYELLRGQEFAFDPARYLDPYLSQYGNVERADLLQAISNFLDPRADDVRHYVLRQLMASFVIRAAGLDDETLKRLNEATQTQALFDCFLDTNVLFSALDLHDNPANDVAQELFSIAQRHRDRIQINLNVLPITLEEAQSALGRAQEHCRGLVLNQKIASAASRVPMSGLTSRFIRQAQEGGIRSANDYFDPLTNNLLALCRDRSVELHNADLDPYKVREDVATDIVSHLEFERLRRPHPKSYEQVEHDIVTWHYVRERRSAYKESPMEARYWIVTLDYRLIAYDAHRSARANAIPICIDPAALLQLLQFWVPRTEELERAFLASIRIGFLFQEFDAEAEEAVLKILRTLSRFANADELSESAVSQIVLNTELRRRMGDVDDPEEEVGLIREELIEMERVLHERVSQLEDEVATVEAVSQQDRQQLDRTMTELEEMRSRVAGLSSALDGAERRLEKEKGDRKQQELELESTKLRYFMWTTGIVAVALVLVASWGIRLTDGRVIPAASIAVGVVVAIGWLQFVHRRMARSPEEVQREFAWVDRLISKVSTVALGVLSGVLGNLLYGWLFT